MKRTATSMLLVMASAAAAHAGGPPAHAAPFLTGDEDGVHTATGSFGPAKDTTIVVIHSMLGQGSYSGFALVPDAKAKHGQRKLALPKLPVGVVEGGMKTALIANLDKDADDELVLELRVQKSVKSKEGGHSYGTFEYVVLDWDGKQHVRAAALEKKLAQRMASREDHAAELTDADVRAALGVAKK